MGSVEREVLKLIARKALHKKKKVRMGKENWDQIFTHLLEELNELEDAVGMPMTTSSEIRIRQDCILEELGDMLGLLVHATIKSGFQMYQVEQREIAKLHERFE